jgi:hypothetical protein
MKTPIEPTCLKQFSGGKAIFTVMDDCCGKVLYSGKNEKDAKHAYWLAVNGVNAQPKHRCTFFVEGPTKSGGEIRDRILSRCGIPDDARISVRRRQNTLIVEIEKSASAAKIVDYCQSQQASWGADKLIIKTLLSRVDCLAMIGEIDETE